MVAELERESGKSEANDTQIRPPEPVKEDSIENVVIVGEAGIVRPDRLETSTT